MKTPEILIPALRQYQHNDSSGLLACYDYSEVNQIVTQLQAENERLKSKSRCKEMVIQIIKNMIGSDEVTGSDWDYIGDDEYQEVYELLEKRNLEQQAKGLEDYAVKMYKDTESGLIIYAWIMHRASQLRDQAKALKEQGE